MIIKAKEMQSKPRIRLKDGYGTTDFLNVVPDEFRPKNSRLFSVMSLEKGCSVGRHEHTGETEIYYVLQGEGIINDNGIIRPFLMGDCNICGNGDYHSVSNENEATLRIFAVIILD